MDWNIQINGELITAIAALVTAIGVQIQNARQHRKERRERRREIERVARAAARGPQASQELVDESERTGEFTRPTAQEFEQDRKERAARARGRESGRRDT